jgi:hypothetical protein
MIPACEVGFILISPITSRAPANPLTAKKVVRKITNIPNRRKYRKTIYKVTFLLV